ncbi:MAG: preprotein translocase subunit SecG [Hyphomonas sp.]|nr:preprotein translocase subunit SecG [Hyphomonas sp.]
MQNVILVIHIIACLVMIGLVLVQKSEGGGLGIGGGGGGANSLLSGRGAAGAVVRSTIIFGSIFFITSLALTTLANRNQDTRSDVERALGEEDGVPAPISSTEDLFDPSAPLLSGQAGLSDAEAAEPEAETPADDGAEAPAEGDPAPETGNPQ